MYMYRMVLKYSKRLQGVISPINSRRKVHTTIYVRNGFKEILAYS